METRKTNYPLTHGPEFFEPVNLPIFLSTNMKYQYHESKPVPQVPDTS